MGAIEGFIMGGSAKLIIAQTVKNTIRIASFFSTAQWVIMGGPISWALKRSGTNWGHLYVHNFQLYGNGSVQ